MAETERDVLSVFGILAPERIQKLADRELVSEVELKMAAGAESATQGHVASKAIPVKPESAKILNFPSKKARDFEPMPESEGRPAQEELGVLSSTEFMIWQNEMSKRHQELSRNPYESYQKSKQVYIVKSKDDIGKTKTKLAKTQGVLVDKKSS